MRAMIPHSLRRAHRMMTTSMIAIPEIGPRTGAAWEGRPCLVGAGTHGSLLPNQGNQGYIPKA